MTNESLKIGKWYQLRYGYSIVKGKCVDTSMMGGAIFKFYWGDPFRTKIFVENSRIYQECNPPGFFSNL